jgi:hypothetical protein
MHSICNFNVLFLTLQIELELDGLHLELNIAQNNQKKMKQTKEFKKPNYRNKDNSYDSAPTSTWTLPLKPPKDFIPVKSTRILSETYDNVFLLRNVLSPSECEHFIKETEALKFHPCFEYPQDYRSNTRVIVTDVELANRITKRIESHVPRIHTQMKKNWQFHGLNECFRFCRYAPAQKFEAHLDGAFTRAFDDKSYYTFMIYLNDGFNGGSTRFLTKHHDVLYSVVPEQGMALVFPHSIYHDGEPLQDNLKYIMRSDLMYKRLN